MFGFMKAKIFNKFKTILNYRHFKLLSIIWWLLVVQCNGQKQDICGKYYPHKPSLLTLFYYQVIKQMDVYYFEKTLDLNRDSTFIESGCSTWHGKWKVKNDTIYLYYQSDNDSALRYYGKYHICGKGIICEEVFVFKKETPHKKKKVKSFMIKK